jgi:hypothetical protein
MKNVGSIDRFVRIIAGLALLSLLILVEGNWRWLGLIGLVPLVTGILSWGPAYSAFGISSCGMGTRKAA